ncbi:MAG: long-chain fatty acid--CoA ligase [Archangium sp.]|nr:long-chain fatty acid--CoA ligase [Archangium sp.]
MSTLGEMADVAERSRPTGVMAWRRVDGAWTSVEWSALRVFRREVMAALHGLGIARGDRVAILSHTCWEWGALDLAITSLGAITIGVYPTSTTDAVEYILTHSRAKVCFVEESQFARLAPVFEKLPGLRVVGLGGALDSLRAEGRSVLARESDVPERRMKDVKPDDEATFVYTSGTSGPPRAAVLTHRGVIEMSKLGGSALGATAQDVAVSYLPMAHVLTRVNYYAYVSVGGTAWYAEALEKVNEAWLAARPTMVSAVPRVLEKAQARIMERVNASSPLRQKLFHRALASGLKKLEYVERGASVPLPLRLETALWDRLVSKKLKRALGWENARFAMCGGAPTRQDVIRFFHALGVPVLEGYGLTETSSPVAVNVPGAWRIGTVGRPLKGVELKLASDGEILVRSPGVFRRYEGDEDATKAAFEPDGFFRTGDIGTVDADGYLRITDRKRDIIITAGGKNVAPQNIEAVVREDARISLVAVHGDRQPYLVALVTVQPEVLAAHASDAKDGLFPETSKLHREVQAVIEKANGRLAPYESIKKFRVLAEDFSVENGLLTPTLKVKRKAVLAKYQSLFDGLYA